MYDEFLYYFSFMNFSETSQSFSNIPVLWSIEGRTKSPISYASIPSSGEAKTESNFNKPNKEPAHLNQYFDRHVCLSMSPCVRHKRFFRPINKCY